MTSEGAIERMALEQAIGPTIFQYYLREIGLSRDEMNWRTE
jgi:hypothetical protein